MVSSFLGLGVGGGGLKLSIRLHMALAVGGMDFCWRVVNRHEQNT